jgi:poly [ADP-ribose] polymerase
MSNEKYAKLIMVSTNNNNKFYEMQANGSNFNVKYGRVESTVQTASYPMHMWSTKYNEKIRKGYKDVTDFVTVEVTKVAKDNTPLENVKEKLVNDFLVLMKAYTDRLVSTTYSVKAEAVSQKQVDAAQKIIDELNKMDDSTMTGAKKVNDKLVELYTVIPRRMGQVNDYLLPNIKLNKTLVSEQDNLDAMAAQVSLIKPKTAKEKKAETKKSQTMLDKLGLTMAEAKVYKEIDYLLKQSHGRKVHAIFEVNKPAEDSTFDGWVGKQKDKSTKHLIHGTRCTSVIPILEIGLKIRPTGGNFQFSGKAYGDGNYFSEHMQKSLGYTGSDPDKIILVYEVHTGNPFVYDGWFRGNSFPLNYSELQKRGFDSTFVKAGNGLLNSEIIAYNEQQNRIKYIIWLK